MSSKTTWRLFFLALGLFAFIYFVERRSPGPAAKAKPRVFALFDPAAVTALELHVSNQVIRVEKTNDAWRLTTPSYPAQTTPIEMFIATLSELSKSEVIGPADVSAQPGKLKDFGLDPPLAKFSITVGSNRHHLHLGARTPLSDEIYAQMTGSGEVVVTDGSILKAAPASADVWRSPMLLHMAGRPFDRLQIHSRQRLLEFERDPTNQIWRISKPTPARANHERILQLLQLLNIARVKQFITDSPAADLEPFGLQTPALELAFALDTNRVASFQFGASPTNDPGSVYVRRMAATNVVTVPRELLDALNQPPRAFHDPRLISSDLAQVSLIQVNGTNGFTVARGTNRLWQITAPTPMAADQELMKAFLTNLLHMEIVDFAKEVPTELDLKQFGLVPPRFTMSLFGGPASPTATNSLLMQLDLGGNKTVDTVYAWRSDETPVYVTPWEFGILPKFGWQLRDRRIFDFVPANVTTITFTLKGHTNRLTRLPQGWTSDVIENEKIEEAIFRLGRLQAYNWSAKGAQELASLAINDESLAVELGVTRDGKPAPAFVRFGRRGMRNIVYAATVLPGDTEMTAFEFPGEVFEQFADAFGLKRP